MPEFLDLHGKTTKVVRAAADAALRRHGLRLGQDHLLAALWEQDGRTPGEVAAATSVTTPAVTKATMGCMCGGMPGVVCRAIAVQTVSMSSWPMP